MNISDIRKPSHAEKIEGDPVPGDRHCRALIPGLQKLASDDLIALQIKGGKRAFPHPGFPIRPLDAVVCVAALPEIMEAKPALIPRIRSALEHANLSGYADSMQPLLLKDIVAVLQTMEA